MPSTLPTTMVRLRLICLTPPATNPPAGDDICGLQDRHGQLDTGVVQPDGAVRYEPSVPTTTRVGDAMPRLSGPFVHGPASAPFLYLSVRDPHNGTWVRRLKIPLATITQHQIEAASATENGYLVARIAGTGSGTVPLLDEGWTIGM